MEMNHYIDDNKYMSRYLVDPLSMDQPPVPPKPNPESASVASNTSNTPCREGNSYEETKVVYLNEYTVKHVSNGKEKVLCIMCNMEFDTAKAALKHSKIHGASDGTEDGVQDPNSKQPKQSSLICQTCNITFPDTVAKKAHMAQEHKSKTSSSAQKVKNITCEICYKCFAQPAHLTNHLLVHTGVRNYSCQYCNKKFKQRGHVINHHKIHLDEKNYKCPECGKTFRQTAHLRTHIKIHTGEKDHVCILCTKVFTQSGQLQTHMRTHTNERKYQCPMCDMKFKQSGHLQSHVKRHEKKLLVEQVKVELEDTDDEEEEEELAGDEEEEDAEEEQEEPAVDYEVRRKTRMITRKERSK